MVILFSGRKSTVEKEIIGILRGCGANYISDSTVAANDGCFTIVSEYKKTDLKLKSGIAVFIDDTNRFDNQMFPDGIIGICEDTNLKALEIFKSGNIPVISCGMNAKNTITFSSLNSNSVLASLQRSLIDRAGNSVEPGEFKIRLTKAYTPFAVMASAAVLLLNGIVPEEF